MRRAGRLLAAVLLLVTNIQPLPARAGGYLNYGVIMAPTSIPVDGGCATQTRIWFGEYGMSGVTAFKVKFELRSPNDPGFYGTTYQTRGYFYWGTWPDDIQYHWQRFFAGFRFASNSTYKVRAVMIGIRPGLWNRDRKLTADLGTTGCSGGEYGA